MGKLLETFILIFTAFCFSRWLSNAFAILATGIEDIRSKKCNGVWCEATSQGYIHLLDMMLSS